MKKHWLIRHATAMSPALFLLGAHGAVVVSGFVFWLAAGRLTSTADVGASAAVISMAMLTAILSQLGLPQVALAASRGGGHAASEPDALFSLLWMLAIAGSLAGFGVLVAVPPTHHHVSLAAAGGALVLGSVGVAQGTFVWFIASADRHPSVALVASTVEAVLKMLLVVPLAQSFGANGLVLAWAGSVFLASCIATWGFLPRIAGRRLRFGWPSLQRLPALLRLGFASHVGDLFLFTPTTGVMGWLIPAIVVARYGADPGGVFYISWALAAAMNAVPFAVSTTAIARTPAGGDELPPWGRAGALVVLAVPLVLFLALFAERLLSFFGGTYAALGVDVLRALAISGIVVAANAGLSARLKIRHATSLLQVLGILAAGPVILAAIVLPRDWGTEAVARAWLASQAVAFAITGTALYWGLRQERARSRPAGVVEPSAQESAG